MANLQCAFLANHHILVKKLDTEALLPDCISRGLLTLEEQELISHEATASQKTDRFLTIIHRRGQLNLDVFDKFLELLSDRDVTSGQLLDEVVKKIRADSVDPEVQARFVNELDGDKPLSLHSIEDKIIKTLIVNEVLPQLISNGVVSIQENELIRSRSQEEEKARELLKIIRHGGRLAYDVFVEVLLQSETQASLGEWLKIQWTVIDDNYDKKSVGSEVLNSKRFNQFLNECEESVNKLMAEIAMKFYSLGFEEGLQAAMVSRIKTVGDRAAVGPPPPPDTTKSRAIAEQLKVIADKLPNDIQEETRVAFIKLFQKTSVFTVSRESIRATCAGIMVKHHTHFPSGWHQIAFVYYAMFQVVQTIKQESGDVPTETRELQVANFVGPTLVDLGLYSWMEKHGGIEKLGSAVEGENAAVFIEDFSIDPES